MSDHMIVLISLGVFIILVIIQKIMRSSHPVRSAVLSSLLGILALAAVNLCAGFTSVWIPVSRLSLAVSAVLGIPGVTAMLMIHMILSTLT